MHQVCANSSGFDGHLGYDGENVVRTNANGAGDAWTFVHGPGIDDPIMGYYRGVSGINKLVYFITDGSGRFIAAGDPTGSDASDDDEYVNTGGWLHGAAGDGYTFDVTRPGSSVDSLGFFRNRIYDQRTGRWTQEDPIGVSGGLNLYAFAGNNPVVLHDPFGLCPDSLKPNTDECRKWNDAKIQSAKAFVTAERNAGNPHALPFTNHTTQGLNEEDVVARCGQLGVDTRYACALDGYVILNADLPVELLAAIIVHEEQHPLGERLFGRNSRAAGEECAQKRASLFTLKLSDYKAAYVIKNHPYMTGGGWNPNATRCGF